jgi:hypothetical protein
VREIRTLHAMWRGLESDLRLGYRGTPSGNGRNTLGLAFGIPPVLDPTNFAQTRYLPLRPSSAAPDTSWLAYNSPSSSFATRVWVKLPPWLST